MMDRALRLPKKRLLEPAAKRLSEVSPLIITLLGLGVGVLAALAVALGYPRISRGLWLINRFLDGLDGELARMCELESDLGGYFDIMADLAVYTLIPLGLAFYVGTPAAWLALAVMLAVFYVNAGSWMYLAALLEKRRQGALARGEVTSITMPAGLIEGAETIVFYCLFLLLPQFIAPLFVLLASLVVLTTLQRLDWAYRYLR